MSREPWIAFCCVLGICLLGYPPHPLRGADPAPPKAKPLPAKKVMVRPTTRQAVSTQPSTGQPSNTGSDHTYLGTPPTHVQTRVITPKFANQAARLHTFCLGPEGNLYCCVSGVQNSVQVYMPSGTLRATHAIPFQPTAINFAPNGKIFFVAGEGRVARLDITGKVTLQSWTPNIGDPEAYKKKVVEAMKDEVEQRKRAYKTQIGGLEKRIEEMEAIPEAERTPRQKSQLSSYKSNRAAYNQVLKQTVTPSRVNPEAAMKSRSTISALAVTGSHVFICCRVLKGYGYEVWRADHDLKNAERVLESLSGCCGQCDIQATDEKLLVAHNTRFRVEVYDHEGEQLTTFGKQDRKAIEGFGSCCNPMNVRCCSNGDILTAESSIGAIKRFSAQGKFLGFVGKANIGGGCKHVALAWDEKNDHYYLQHQDASSICVLAPVSKASGASKQAD